MSSLIALAASLVLGALTAALAHLKEPSANAPTVAEHLHSTAQTVSFNTFDRERTGPAQGWTLVPLSASGGGRWEVANDYQAASRPNVLAHEAGSQPGQWDLALSSAAPLTDEEVELAIKPVDGDPRLSGGVVWRYENPQSFYLLEIDSANDTLRLYRFKKGKAKVIDSQMAIVTAGRWHSLRLDVVDQTYSVYWDDDLVMAGHDKTWLKAGAVGLACDSGSKVYFDNWTLKAPPAKPPL